MAIKKINTLLLFVLVGFKPIFSVYGAHIEQRTMAMWDWNYLKASPKKAALGGAVGLALAFYFWGKLFPAQKSIHQLKKTLWQLKLLALPPLEIEHERKEKIDQIQRTVDAYEKAIQSNNLQDIIETGFRLRDLKEDLNDLDNLSAIEKAEPIAWKDSALGKIPQANKKPLLHQKSENTTLFERVDQLIIDWEKRRIIKRETGPLKSKANNKVALFKKEFQQKKLALYNKKNNISTPQTDRLIKELASQQRRVQQKAVKINQTNQLIQEKQKRPFKNKNAIKQANANITKLNDEIDTMLRIKPGDLKDQLATHEWHAIKAWYPDPREKLPESREELEKAIESIIRGKQMYAAKKSLNQIGARKLSVLTACCYFLFGDPSYGKRERINRGILIQQQIEEINHTQKLRLHTKQIIDLRDAFSEDIYNSVPAIIYYPKEKKYTTLSLTTEGEEIRISVSVLNKQLLGNARSWASSQARQKLFPKRKGRLYIEVNHH